MSYCLHITDIEPMKYGLFFERFLNPERVSMPDIDMDFGDTRRGEVVDYVRRKYGDDHVGADRDLRHDGGARCDPRRGPRAEYDLRRLPM